jgi:hypothetical protein
MKKSFLILYTRTRDGRIGRMEEREDGDYMTFSVYGTFTEPEKGVNFFVIRCKPTKRDAFPRKLRTAINALVQPWYKPEDWHHGHPPLTAHKFAKLVMMIHLTLVSSVPSHSNRMATAEEVRHRVEEHPSGQDHGQPAVQRFAPHQRDQTHAGQ